MNIPLLTQLPLTYADSLSFENSGAYFQIRITNLEHQLVVLLKKVLGFKFSRNAPESDEGWIELIAITHEYRRPTAHELRNCSFLTGDPDTLPPLHIIDLYGNFEIQILCEEVEVNKLPSQDS
ncbi:hypothetical protein [Leptolyngbya ohadii]|uniref:hypothetical protein n=1 Tax=Leptolyngbya ohadii TaxID=1962290 RepID=UPI000B5A0CB2|nr:hypothetical protein [Leptolyngbya ohadii]